MQTHAMWVTGRMLIAAVCGWATWCAFCPSAVSAQPHSDAAPGQGATTLPSTQPAAPEALRPDEANLQAFVDLARRDLRLHKAMIIAQNLPLTNDEAASFWPIQREYEADLAAINDQRLALMKKYFARRIKLDAETATALARETFDLESQRTELKRKYFERLRQVIPAAKAARFFQLDNQLNMVVDLKVAASLPLIR